MVRLSLMFPLLAFFTLAKDETNCIFSFCFICDFQVGDPPNVIIGTSLQQYIGFVDFLGALLPAVVLVSFYAIVGMLILYRKQLRNVFDVQEVKNAADSARITDKGLLIKAGISVMSVLISFLLSPLLNANVAPLAVIGAIGLLIMASPRNISGALELVE